MSGKYAAEVEIVLVGFENLNDAEDELEKAMSEIGFKKGVIYYAGRTDQLPSELEQDIRAHLTGNLTHSEDFTVHVINQGEKIIRSK
jgi:tRNA U38,U39,U40 pseudouridine synthase TruA